MAAHPSLIRRGVDRLGIALSAACAVHCVAGLALAAVLGLGATAVGTGALATSTLGTALLDPRIHEYGLMLAVAVGALGLGVGAARHRQPGLLLLGLAGLALMSAGVLAPHGPLEAGFTIPGVLLLAMAHLRNLRHAH
ncbi:MAG TPA: MerC domain-containing protein [Novosphingobium sp.]|nr:MerC domain-containing protein [Novosphingobium sp.]